VNTGELPRISTLTHAVLEIFIVDDLPYSYGFRRFANPPGEKAADISKAYRQQERHAKDCCAARRIHAMSVSYETLVHHPDQILPQLAAFLGIADKVHAMRGCIDPALHRAWK